MRKTRLRLDSNKKTQYMARKDVVLHLKAIYYIYKISFVGKYKDIYPSLFKKKRQVLNANQKLESKTISSYEFVKSSNFIAKH
ncbi:MAG: hypothetical protein LBF12_02260 [Christensenellaceae bacterium]|jgi:hypothetical protein|nr:hypothetical protein [Christensenellaceae bacterium]